MSTVTLWLILAVTPDAAVDFRAVQFVGTASTQQECVQKARTLTDFLLTQPNKGAAFCVAATRPAEDSK